MVFNISSLLIKKIEKIVKPIIKKIFGKYAKYVKRFFYDPKKRGLTELFLDNKFDIIHNQQKIFSLRDFGGATASRGRNFFYKEPNTIKWIDEFDSNSKFFDIGANIGIFSLYAAYKGHKVFSFEPESLNFALLNLNIFDNNFSNQIIPYPFSIHSSDKISELNIPELHWGKSGSIFDNDKKFDKTLFPKKHLQGSYGISIDTFINESSFKPNYIKIDVDGNELEVIKGMSNYINNNSNISILIEIDESMKNYDYENILSILEESSFKIVTKDLIYQNEPIFNYIFKKN